MCTLTQSTLVQSINGKTFPIFVVKSFFFPRCSFLSKLRQFVQVSLSVANIFQGVEMSSTHTRTQMHTYSYVRCERPPKWMEMVKMADNSSRRHLLRIISIENTFQEQESVHFWSCMNYQHIIRMLTWIYGTEFLSARWRRHRHRHHCRHSAGYHQAWTLDTNTNCVHIDFFYSCPNIIKLFIDHQNENGRRNAYTTQAHWEWTNKRTKKKCIFQINDLSSWLTRIVQRFGR